MKLTEVAVVGAGPAGLAAACEVAKAGVKVCLIDENKAPGGQLVKQIHKFFGSKEHLAGIRGRNIGLKLLEEAKRLNVDIQMDTTVWGYFDGTLSLVSNGKVDLLKADRLIIATGASENPLVFPGWTIPGVMGAGAAQTLMNNYRVLPGKKVLMLGGGNVGLIVSYQLIQAGANVVGIVEASDNLGGYEVHANKIRRCGVPIYTNSTIIEAKGKDRVTSAIIGKVNENWEVVKNSEIEISVDTICIAVGLTPLIELPAITGCKLEYNSSIGGWIPIHDDDYRTTVEGVYVAGDVTGIEEASIAMEEGKISGVAVAASLNYIDAQKAKEMVDIMRKRLNELRSGSKNLFATTHNEIHEIIPTNGPASIKVDSPKLIIECYQEIPCNPCENACPHGAITIGNMITNCPQIDDTKCTACGICIAACPGLAIFLVDPNFNSEESSVTIPYEFLPIPSMGEKVEALDRDGLSISEARVIKVINSPRNDHTSVITIAVPKGNEYSVRMIKVGSERHG